MMKRTRLLAAIIIGVLGLASLGARCIENATLYVDSEGRHHITGEMFNDTDVSASSVTLQGTLFDSAGRVLAQTSGPLCPVSVKPQSRNAFDLRFAEVGLQGVSRFDVRPIAGTTLESRQPWGAVRIVGFDVRRFAEVAVRGDIQNISQGISNITYTNMSVCIAFYNSTGKVVHVFSSPVEGTVAPGAYHHFGFTDTGGVPTEADRAVLWFVPGPGLEWASSEVTMFISE